MKTILARTRGTSRRWLMSVALLSGTCLTPFPAASAGETAPAEKPRIKVLFDTDIGSDIDDAVALAYLLAQPRCELLGITTVTGEPVKRAQLASALCQVAGRPDVPIYPGAEQPLISEQRQPRAPQHDALAGMPHRLDFPQGEAIEFLRRTIRAHPGEVTLLAVGPLTNVALLFRTDPEIPALLKELVLMGGQFGAQPLAWGNKEWNAMLDPEATAIVFGSRPPQFRAYGLDVTLQVVMSPETAAARFASDPRLQLVHRFAHVWFKEQKQMYFHDPLAAVAIFAPDVCGMERGAATVVLQPDEEKGRTRWQPDPAGPQQVAMQVNPATFFEAYFGVFARGDD